LNAFIFKRLPAAKGNKQRGWVCVEERPLITAISIRMLLAKKGCKPWVYSLVLIVFNGIHDLAKARFCFFWAKPKERALPEVRKKEIFE